MRNHGGQSLEILASRGGLGPDELAAVLEDRPWVKMSTAAQVAALHDLITVCSTDELTVEQIAQADAEGALHVDSDGLRWVPRRWVTLWTQRHKS